MSDLGFLNQLCVQPYPQAQSSMIVSESKILWTEASLNITLTSNLGPITVSMYSQETQTMLRTQIYHALLLGPLEE